ncbi:hypothetical protein NPIL_182561 [Nephila pilipes]|uniref:Uncharacterized protein n=1 Tax=Nephila pilipes TaxID=299642 RepID=A0A8X6UH77_NEPPI|nr:hypothetical protein NPIL_182561 [Nephila pilipes]
MVGFGEFGQANVRRDLRLPDNCSPGNDSRCSLGRKSSGCKMTGIVAPASVSSNYIDAMIEALNIVYDDISPEILDKTFL